MGLYCFLGLLMDGPATLASSAIGLAIAPHFDEPYKSSSVSACYVAERCPEGSAAGSIAYTVRAAEGGYSCFSPASTPAKEWSCCLHVLYEAGHSVRQQAGSCGTACMLPHMGLLLKLRCTPALTLFASICSQLADVWNHRWNLTAGGTLRFLIHDPILQGMAGLNVGV